MTEREIAFHVNTYINELVNELAEAGAEFPAEFIEGIRQTLEGMAIREAAERVGERHRYSPLSRFDC